MVATSTTTSKYDGEGEDTELTMDMDVVDLDAPDPSEISSSSDGSCFENEPEHDEKKNNGINLLLHSFLPEDQFQRSMVLLASGTLLFLVVIVIPAAVLWSSSPKESGIDHVLLPTATATTWEAITNDPDSPQHAAYQWLMEDPKLASYEAWKREQRFALVTFYLSLNGPRWTVHGENESREEGTWIDHLHDECEWTPEMISCNANGRVQRLVTSKIKGFKGSVPEEAQLLTDLAEMDFSDNTLLQSLGDFLPFQALPSLQSLVCNRCNLEGTLSPSIGFLTNLQHLALDSNPIAGGLPTTLGLLTNLQNISMVFAELSGPLPSELGLLSNLRFMDLDHNSLSHSLPSEIGMMTALESLVLYNNKVAGTLPSTIGLLTNLFSIGLLINRLSGSIPSEVGNLSQLTSLSLGYNKLSGLLPSTIGLMESLTFLDLEANALTGSIPSEIALLDSNLRIIDMEHNDLTGRIPPEMATMSNLDLLKLKGNNLQKPDPGELCPLIREGLHLEIDSCQSVVECCPPL
ncbi:LRR receptor-like serine threonine-protein kinase [Seminavis robusta]|uniref:LRR receptor-like serine threonine-protein kinase n=1 Tax=Seminavis robusta TaxID=568900 RepID=A0A9N8HDL2_9STRA|nr:LRR receptor-like serine threonine-protein kinase [Seminavis robusta]|eukprot:Sro465_g148690.1 LRR receptor-like serine threonine-protein kinase (520) ;mRNA; f:59955-61514